MPVHIKNQNKLHRMRRLGLKPHSKHKNFLTDARSNRYCRAHYIRIDKCRECGGAGLCAHGKYKSDCYACGGTSMCVHGRKKCTCWQCAPREGIFCATCAHTRLSEGRKKRGVRICAGCERREEKMQRIEHVWKEKLENLNLYASVHDKSIVAPDTCVPVNKRRADFLYLTQGARVPHILIECDEHAHAGIPPACEMRRLQEIHDQLIVNTGALKSLYVIRFDPYSSTLRDATLLKKIKGAVRAGLACRRKDARGVILHPELIGYSKDRALAYALDATTKQISI